LAATGRLESAMSAMPNPLFVTVTATGLGTCFGRRGQAKVEHQWAIALATRHMNF
jgi:hypothetical protein